MILTKHFIERMNERGIKTAEVLSTLRNPMIVEESHHLGGKKVYRGSRIAVVVDPQDQTLVTVFTINNTRQKSIHYGIVSEEMAYRKAA